MDARCELCLKTYDTWALHVVHIDIGTLKTWTRSLCDDCTTQLEGIMLRAFAQLHREVV